MSESRLVIAADFSFCKRKREHACALEVSKRGHACDGARGDSTGRADRAMGRIEQNRAIAFHAPTPPLLAQVPRAAVRCATSPLFSGWHWTPARAQSGRPHHAVGHSCWRWRPPGATLDRSESPTRPTLPTLPMAATRRTQYCWPARIPFVTPNVFHAEARTPSRTTAALARTLPAPGGGAQPVGNTAWAVGREPGHRVGATHGAGPADRPVHRCARGAYTCPVPAAALSHQPRLGTCGQCLCTRKTAPCCSCTTARRGQSCFAQGLRAATTRRQRRQRCRRRPRSCRPPLQASIIMSSGTARAASVASRGPRGSTLVNDSRFERRWQAGLRLKISMLGTDAPAGWAGTAASRKGSRGGRIFRTGSAPRSHGRPRLCFAAEPCGDHEYSRPSLHAGHRGARGRPGRGTPGAGHSHPGWLLVDRCASGIFGSQVGVVEAEEGAGLSPSIQGLRS